MEIKYSKQQFEGFTHRFIVVFKVDNDCRNDVNLTIYSNSDSFEKLHDFINEKKSDKVRYFAIIHRSSKEQDEMSAKFIDEVLNIAKTESSSSAGQFTLVKGSVSAHCCFDYTIVEKGNTKMGVCECFDEKDAKMICDALNKQH